MRPSDPAALSPLTLQAAETGRDLLQAVEAAGYGRVVQVDEGLEHGPDAPALMQFLAVFEDCAETGAGDPAAATLRLGGCLAQLSSAGLTVHAGVTEIAIGDEQPSRIPLAVLTIGRSALPTRTVYLPDRAEPAEEERPLLN